KAASFENNKHLMLLDGIRINHARANKAPIENELPLLTLDNLEMLKGPASSIYGQSAFYGVVSLHSAFNDSNDLFTHFVYEPKNQGSRAVMTGNLHTAGGHSYLALSKYSEDSSDQLVGPNLSPLQKYYNDQDAHFVYGRHQYSNDNLGTFTLGHIELSRTSGLGEHWNGDFSAPGNQIEWVTDIDYLQWQKPWTEKWKTSLTLMQNNSTEEGTFTTFNRTQAQTQSPVMYASYLVDVDSSMIEAELIWQGSDTQSLLFGASVEERQDMGGYFTDLRAQASPINPGDKMPRGASEQLDYSGLYVQYYELLESMAVVHLTLGARHDKGEYRDDTFSQISPRVALVKQMNEQWTIKGSYSTALRSPGLKEYTLNAETRDSINVNAQTPAQALAQLPDSLSPETFTSYEFTAFYETQSAIVRFNYFSNETEKALDGRPVFFVDKSGNDVRNNSFGNAAQVFKVQGVEVELDWRLSSNWHLNAHVSHADADGDSDAATADNALFKASASVTGHLPWFVLNLSYRHHGRIEGDVGHISTADVNLSSGNDEGFNWHIKMLNVFDTDNYYSSNGLQGNPMPLRSFELGVSYQF
ncbi:MAG: TonB-dependent receptor, partial [Psychrosphaera sp.]|nr:TonB-dependent receptor [Psychrosphaera sp.]